MVTFQYVKATSVAQVCSLLNEYGPDACVLAGGTDLLVRIKNGDRIPRLVIDLKGVRDLSGSIEVTGSGLRLGSLATMAEISCHTGIRQLFPALAEAARNVGSPQIRNRATLAGNICNASPSADTAPALLIYEATVNLVGLHGRRTIPIEQFFRGPGQTALELGEIVESVDLPAPPVPAGDAYLKLARRRGVDLATVSVAALLTAAGQVRVALGAVGPTPFRARAAEAILSEGAGNPRTLDPHAVNTAIRLIKEASRPISDVRASEEYRRAMAAVLTQRALEAARLRLEGREVCLS